MEKTTSLTSDPLIPENQNAFSTLDWPELNLKIRGYATSLAAKDRLKELGPKSDASKALEHVEHIFDASEVISKSARPFMESLDLFDPWYLRVKKAAVLKTLELRDIRKFCLEVLALSATLSEVSNPWAQQLRNRLLDAEPILGAIDQLITSEGEIRADASQKLKSLFTEKENLARNIQKTLDRFIKDYDMQTSLQDKYVTTREGRWVLPIRSGRQHSVAGVIHGSSQTKQTVFKEPDAIIPLNNRLREVEVEIEEEIERLLREISDFLHRKEKEFKAAQEALIEGDYFFALAQFCMALDARKFKFSEDRISLIEACHPLLVLSGEKVVPNTVELKSDRRLLLLSGPNAGGKTVLLKTVGLCAHFARCGLPLPTRSSNSVLPFFKELLVIVGDSQSVEAKLSTFTSHLEHLKQGLNLRGLDRLILIDEIGSNTDPEEGGALARAFVEEYANQKIFGVITSHLGQLKSGWGESSPILPGSLEYDTAHGVPLFKFIPGVPGESLALEIARRLEVPRNILERALSLLSPASQERLRRLQEIEEIKKDLKLLQRDLSHRLREAEEEKQRLQEERQVLETNKEKILRKVVDDAQKWIQEKIQLTEAAKVFNKHQAYQKIKQELPQIIKAQVGASGHSDSENLNHGKAQSAQEFKERFPPGSKVYIISLGQDGIVQSEPNAKGEVFILSQSLRMQVKWQDLQAPNQGQNPTREILRKKGLSFVIGIEETSLDLRGKTVEEALSTLEMFLDRAMAEQKDRVRVVHGFGSESLKKAIRAYLSRSVYVSNWQAATADQGGDGATLVEIHK
jgi:DNA mismatch repair protein MutS2